MNVLHILQGEMSRMTVVIIGKSESEGQHDIIAYLEEDEGLYDVSLGKEYKQYESYELMPLSQPDGQPLFCCHQEFLFSSTH